MSEEKQEVVDKLKKMSVEELRKYESAASFINSSINIAGVSTILFALFYPYIMTVLICTLLAALFAHIGSGVSEFLSVIRGQLEARDK